MIEVTHVNEDEAQPAVVSLVVGLMLAVCIYLAVAVIQWHGAWFGAIGFCVIVPGLAGGTVNSIVRRLG